MYKILYDHRRGIIYSNMKYVLDTLDRPFILQSVLVLMFYIFLPSSFYAFV